MSLNIPSWQILTAHAQPFRGARDLAFCLKVPLDSMLVWASSGGSGEIARMRRLAWTFAARIGDKYQIRLTWSIYFYFLACLYKSTGRAIAVTTVSALVLCCALLTHISDLEQTLKFYVKVLVKVFRSQYLLKLYLDLVDTLPDIRYWSKLLCCTIPTPSLSLRSRSQTLKFYIKVFG